MTAGSKSSPQVNIVAHIAKLLNVPCRVHTPTGALGAEVEQARAFGAEVVQHKAGYNNVIIARAREDAASLGWTNIPFGMECREAIEETAAQVGDLPGDIERLVIPIGSGMSLAGVLWGLQKLPEPIPVLGVAVGADPMKRLATWAPPGWERMVRIERSPLKYDQPAAECRLGEIALDPIYEAKCLPFLREGDLLWAVGIRATAV